MIDCGDFLQRIERICGEFRIDSLALQLLATREIVKGGGVVDVAVLGQFKAGKSSFLNSLIGAEVVPVNVLPATAVVTRIGYGPADRALVHLLSGKTVEIPVGELVEFVAEQGNPGNQKQVSLVDVELCSLEAYRGIRFVDTPGLGSAHAHNTRASLEWLPRVGGALLAVSVSHPVSEHDLKLLAEVSRHTPEIAILLTKADLVSDAQLDAVVEFTQRQVAQHTGRELPVLPYSVAPSLGAMREEVRRFLHDRIVARREETFGGIVEHKVRALSDGCRSYLELALAAAEAVEGAREELRAVLAREKGDMESVRGEVAGFLRDLKSRVRTAAGEKFHGHHVEVTRRLEEALQSAASGWTGTLAETTRKFQEWLAQALEAELSSVSANGEGYLAGFLHKARASLNRTVRAFQDRLAKEIERALGIAFEGALFDAGIAEPKRPDIRVGKTFDTNVELLWFLVPMPLVRRAVNRHFLALLPWEVEKNLARLAGQWADAASASIDELARQALEFMEREVATIERLVGRGDDRRERIRAGLAELGAMGGRDRISRPRFPRAPS